ncbi:MAG TPA: CsbD family protein [Rectinemataceae bacterium]|nr:CsbD family protein [Rectinemataceae bacterium]
MKEDARKVINEQTITNLNGKLDIAKGRIKEAAGVLVGDEALRVEGKADQVAGKAKEFVETTAQKIRETARNTIDKLKDKARQ